MTVYNENMEENISEIKEQTEQTLIQCDMCGEQFMLRRGLLGKTKAENLVVQYFSCPQCGHKYPYILSDWQHRRLVGQIRSIQQDISARRKLGKKVSDAKLRLLKLLLNEAELHQTELRNNHLEAVTALLNKSGQNETIS